MEYLKLMATHSSSNGLTYPMLYKLFGRAIMRPHPKLQISEDEEFKSKEELLIRIMKDFIDNQELLFQVIEISAKFPCLRVSVPLPAI